MVVIAAGSLTAGCISDGGGNGTTDDGTTDPPSNECDPDDVRRPPIVEDANHPPQGYGTKPMELIEQSVGDYLADFETAYAWNRILTEHAPVTSLGVNTTTPWTPETTDDGFVAWSRIETDYTKEGDDDPTTRTYIANYYVSQGPVYRVESESEPVDAATHPDRQLVQCGSDDGN